MSSADGYGSSPLSTERMLRTPFWMVRDSGIPRRPGPHIGFKVANSSEIASMGMPPGAARQITDRKINASAGDRSAMKEQSVKKCDERVGLINPARVAGGLALFASNEGFTGRFLTQSSNRIERLGQSRFYLARIAARCSRSLCFSNRCRASFSNCQHAFINLSQAFHVAIESRRL